MVASRVERVSLDASVAVAAILCSLGVADDPRTKAEVGPIPSPPVRNPTTRAEVGLSQSPPMREADPGPVVDVGRAPSPSACGEETLGSFDAPTIEDPMLSQPAPLTADDPKHAISAVRATESPMQPSMVTFPCNAPLPPGSPPCGTTFTSDTSTQAPPLSIETLPARAAMPPPPADAPSTPLAV